MPPRFLTSEEYALFKAHYQPRHVRSGDGQPETLESAVANLLSGRTRRDDDALGLHQAARVIQGHRNDGISWLCERLAEVVVERSPALHLFTFKGQRAASGLPEIAHHVRLGPSLRVFARAGLYDSRLLRRVLVDGAVVLAAVAFALVADYLRPTGTAGGILSNGLLSVTILSVLTAILTNHVRLGGSSERLSELAKRIDDECARHAREGGSSDAIQQAVDGMAVVFHGLARPACVIIDHSARLDAFTQAVLDKAMRAGLSGGVGRVSWVVVEQREAGVLSRELAIRPSARSEYAGGQIEILQLNPLTVEENESVLRSHHLALDRARDGLFVKQLVRGANAAEIDQLKTMLDALAQTEASDTGLRASTLLRFVAANSEPPGFERPASEYERIFTERTGEGKRRLFPIVLQAYLGMPYVPKERVKELLHGLQTNHGRLMMRASSPIAPLRVPAIACDALKQWPVTQVPHETIEWFWFLWWTRQSPPQTASTSQLLKLAHHARSVKLDARLMATPDGPALARETVLSLTQLADACLQATLFADALGTAKALLVNIGEIESVPPAQADALTDQTWTSVTRICWQVYLATGDESFLVHLLSLLSDASFVPGPRPAAPRDIVSPYLRAMNTATDELDATERALQHLLTRDASLAKRLRVFMQWRTLDVVQLCEGCSTPDTVVRAGLSSSSAVIESIDRAEVIEICDGIYKDAERRFTILDHLVLREALRYTVRRGDAKLLREILPAFVLAAGEARGRTRPGGLQMTLLERAFQLQTLSVGLDAVLKLAVAGTPHVRAQYQHRSASDDLPFRTNLGAGGMTRDLQDLLALAADVVGKPESIREHDAISPRIFALVNQIYLHAALAWEELGLGPLRDRMMMDRAQYLFEFSDADPKHPETFRAIIQSLGPALSSEGVQPALNHLELSEFFRPVTQLCSVYITEAVTRLLRLAVASDITLLFCMFLNHIPWSSAAKTLGAVDHVVKLLTDRPFRAHFVERFGADPEAGSLINTLLDVGVRLGKPDLRSATDRLAKELLEEPGLSPEIATEIGILRDLYRVLGSPAVESDAEIDAILAAWSGQRAHWAYPAVLAHVLGGRPDAPSVVEASLSLLEEGDSAFQGSPAVVLALRVAELAVKGTDESRRGRAARILRDSVVPQAGRWQIEHAEHTFWLLAKLDSENSHGYYSHLANWTQLRLERDRAEAFTQMLHDGHFFGVFRSYWDGLRIYGLPSIVLEKAWHDTVKDLINTDQQPTAIEHCLERMRVAAPPLISRPGNVASVVVDFVTIGMVLFGPDVPAGNEVDIARQQLNKATAKDLRAFLDVIEMCETVPASLRDFIRDHRRFITSELAKRSAA